MAKKITKVKDCNAAECVYNTENKCHAIAITVGGGLSPACDTSMVGSIKGGSPDINTRVGACKVENCQFNKLLECTAQGIEVKMQSNRAECATFKVS